MNKECIVFDFDDTLVIGNFLNIANECFNGNKTIDELKEYYVEDNFDITSEQLEKYLDELVKRDLYENATILEGAYDSLKMLASSGKYEVIIFSACAINQRKNESGNFFARKYEYIVKTFYFIEPKNIILGGNKSIICSKYFIDDRIDHLISSNAKYKILFTAYHNKDIPLDELEKNNIIRVDNHEQLYEFITTH